MKQHLFLTLTLFLGLLNYNKGYAQKQSIRTELPSLLMGNINLDYGIALSDRISLHIPVFVKPLTFGLPVPIRAVMIAENLEGSGLANLNEFGAFEHWQHAGIEPGIRFWTNGVHNRSIYIGMHALGKVYRYGGSDIDPSYKEGYAVGGFLSLGYSRELADRWNLEFEVGIGCQHRAFKQYTSAGRVIRQGTGLSAALSRFGVQIVYLL